MCRMLQLHRAPPPETRREKPSKNPTRTKAKRERTVFETSQKVRVWATEKVVTPAVSAEPSLRIRHPTPSVRRFGEKKCTPPESSEIGLGPKIRLSPFFAGSAKSDIFFRGESERRTGGLSRLLIDRGLSRRQTKSGSSGPGFWGVRRPYRPPLRGSRAPGARPLPANTVWSAD